MQEVEAKYRLHDPQGLMRVLANWGVRLSEPVVQDDQAYAQPGWRYGESKIGVAFARLRTEAGRHLFTLKKPVDNEMACVEHETEIADREQMHRALVEMGFSPTVRIVKERSGCMLQDVTVCVDNVEHAGWFVEFEKVVAPSQSGTQTQAELDSLARSLGIELERVRDTYDSLVRAALSASAAL